jgi:hypothetical protein
MVQLDVLWTLAVEAANNGNSSLIKGLVDYMSMRNLDSTEMQQFNVLIETLPDVVNYVWNDTHPLMNYCRKGYTNIVNWLLRYFIDHDIFVQCYDMLLKASEFAQWAVVKCLLENFKDLPENVFNVNCATVRPRSNYSFFYAFVSSRDSPLHLVISRRLNPELTALHNAVYVGDTGLVTKLATDANVNLQDSNGDTALHHAYRRNPFDKKYILMIRILTSKFADSSILNESNQTPIDVGTNLHGHHQMDYLNTMLKQSFYLRRYLNAGLLALRIRRRCNLLRLRRAIHSVRVVKTVFTVLEFTSSKRPRLF